MRKSKLVKKIHYEATSEFGVKKFRKYKKLREFIWVYWPEWLHNIVTYKVVDGLRYEGQYVKNSRWPIKF